MWFLLRFTVRFSVIGFLRFNIDQDYVEASVCFAVFTFEMRKRKENATRSNRANGLEKDYGNNKENANENYEHRAFGDLHRQWTTDALENIQFRWNIHIFIENKFSPPVARSTSGTMCGLCAHFATLLIASFRRTTNRNQSHFEQRCYWVRTNGWIASDYMFAAI